MQTEEFMTALLSAMHNGVIAIDRAGVITVFNQAAEAITGIPRHEAVGRPLQEVVPQTGMLEVLATGQPVVGYRQRFGQATIITNRTPIIGSDGQVRGVIGVFQDVTEMQAIAEQLENVQALQKTLETVVENGFNGVVMVDAAGVITMINEAYCRFLGVERAAAIGQHVTKVIENTRMHIVVKTGRAEICEVQRIGSHDVVVSRVPIVQHGQVTAAVGIMLFQNVCDLVALANKLNRLQRETEYYKEELRRVRGAKYNLDNIMGVSSSLQAVKELARRAARTNSTVLILGESGTGKELFAHAIHDLSARRCEPFIRLNCAAIPENLLEAELFGYENGAFTGARKGGKPGKFELAHRGTLFLDEIADMSWQMQAKLLRILQEREVDRLGGSQPVKVDVRFIAATNKDLPRLVAEGRFRQDLYYRLNVITMTIPPLRNRLEDVEIIGRHILRRLGNEAGVQVRQVKPVVWRLLRDYHWPGNVRELENVLERAVNMIDGDVLDVVHLPLYLRPTNQAAAPSDGATVIIQARADAERRAIKAALAAAGGNKAHAARLLGINRSWLYRKLQRYDLDV